MKLLNERQIVRKRINCRIDHVINRAIFKVPGDGNKLAEHEHAATITISVDVIMFS